MQAQPQRRHAREALKFTRLAFTLFWRQSASCVPPHRIDSRTARSIPERFALLSSWETSLLITSMSAGEAMDAECVQLRMIGWQTPTRFGLSSTGGRAIVLYSAMLSLALTTMEMTFNTSLLQNFTHAEFTIYGKKANAELLLSCETSFIVHAMTFS